MDSHLAAVVALLSVLLAPSAAPGRPAAGEPLRDLAVEMRDGTVLLADLWRPAERDGALPILLVRTPYGRRLEEGVARTWTGRGYGVVVQAVRGRDGSEGTWVPWERELEDGHDTIDWVAHQDWCNGRIGMTGGSYLGHAQILAAASGHPSLACVVPLSPGSDGFSDVPFSGGVLHMLIGWLYLCRGPVLDTSGRFPASAHDGNLEHLPLARIDEAWAGFRSEIWQRWVRVESLADMPGLAVWDRLAEAEHRVPALHVGGLWDHESLGTRRNWERFDALAGPHQYLIFGPWPHEPNQSTRYADVEYGEDAVVDLDGMIRSWYAHWLDGEAELSIPRVQVFATGANRWLHLDRWPARDATPRVWHVGGGDGPGLVEHAPTEPISWSWTYDPAELPPPRRDLGFQRTTRLWFEGGDADAVVLATRPFEEDTLLTGPVELELALESSAEDTDVFALLVEVSARGEVRALQRPSPLRLRFRQGFDRVVPLVPGEVASAAWPLGDFAHVFAEGSRLGLALRSDWFPTFARNLGTLEPMATATRTVRQENRIHSGPGRVSAIRLHRVPLDRLHVGRSTSR